MKSKKNSLLTKLSVQAKSRIVSAVYDHNNSI